MHLIQTKYLAILSMSFFTLLFYSCSSKVEAIFEITNSTNQNIQRLTIQPDENKNNHISVEPNSKATLKTNMTKLPKVDGSYDLSFKSNDTIRGLNFGYYSNGYPAESITRIDIHSDTIIIKPEYKKNYQ
jgi:hypothetical protein